MKKTSKKNLKKERASRVRTDYSAGCRISEAERDRLMGEIVRLGGIRPSLGAYTKHALLEYARLSTIEARLRGLRDTVGDGVGCNADWIAQQITDILAGSGWDQKGVAP